MTRRECDLRRSLFDLNIFAIEPGTLAVHVSAVLKNSEYKDLQGVVLRGRSDRKVPDRHALEERWRKFVD
jgi:hypothetical protein